jgi:hypothetical protein
VIGAVSWLMSIQMSKWFCGQKIPISFTIMDTLTNNSLISSTSSSLASRFALDKKISQFHSLSSNKFFLAFSPSKNTVKWINTAACFAAPP